MTTCGSCNAEVRFVKSAKSDSMVILDAVPRKGVIVHDKSGHVGGIWKVKVDPTFPLQHAEASVVDVFTDHHATCEFADRYRKR